MKLVSWNVNGIRACVKKGFLDYFQSIDADIFCIQETKLQQNQISLELDGYFQYWNYAERKGYSGTAVFTKKEPLSVTFGIELKEPDNEGRVITLEYDSFYLVNAYTPNSKRDLARLEYRLVWEDAMRNHLINLNSHKAVIFCGDMNVAHQEIDLKNAKPNIGNSGFTHEEREKMSHLLETGFTDCFRYLYPDRTDSYTWWSFMNKVRERNIGWRIDYFLVSNEISNWVKDTEIHSDVLGSDHCPILLETNMDN
jgi:exodeoxyribonuclease-3